MKESEIQQHINQLSPYEQEKLAEDAESKVANMYPMVRAIQGILDTELKPGVEVMISDPTSDEQPEFIYFNREILARWEAIIEGQGKYFEAMNRNSAMRAIKQSVDRREEGKR